MIKGSDALLSRLRVIPAGAGLNFNWIEFEQPTKFAWSKFERPKVGLKGDTGRNS